MNFFDPSENSLREWARSGLPWPVEDFDLLVASEDRAALLVELASSPAREFALHCLYLIVGDAVRSDFNTSSRAQIEAMLADAEGASSSDPAIGRWIAESHDLLEHPDHFEYGLWCDGGLARRAAGNLSS